jgi:hypothetical protein
MIGGFPPAAGRMSIAQKATLDKGTVNFSHGERGSAGPELRPCGFSNGGILSTPQKGKLYCAHKRSTQSAGCKAAPSHPRRGGRAAGLEGEPCATSSCDTPHRRGKARSRYRRELLGGHRSGIFSRLFRR